jgi:hypothetical protein
VQGLVPAVRAARGLAAGKDADIAVFDDNFTAWGVAIRGKFTSPANAGSSPQPMTVV